MEVYLPLNLDGAHICVVLFYSSQRLRIEIASDWTRLTESALNSSLSFSKAANVKIVERNLGIIGISLRNSTLH